ncbi:MAG: purine-binding chemotaxis protein CheW [Cellvibrio sp.]|nr:purine-binding chemotaxis protein CheW [Cellvibrio sp.]
MMQSGGVLVVSDKVPESGANASRQYLAFTLNGEVFAIDILQIREIIEFSALTEVPMMPITIRGVINLRGSVVPVIDLSARFGKGASAIARRTCVVILEVRTEGVNQTLGVMVDAVNEVMEIAANDIEPAPTFGTRIRTDFIAGMGRTGGRFVIILNVERVFSLEELASLGGLTSSAIESA